MRANHLDKEEKYPAQSLLTYQDYLNKGYGFTLEKFDLRQKTLYHAVAIAALMNCLLDAGEFSALFIKLFGVEFHVHAGMFRMQLQQDEPVDDLLYQLIKEVWARRVQCSVNAMNENNNDNEQLQLASMSELLDISIAVFLMPNQIKTIYGDNKKEIVLIQSHGGYSYLTQLPVNKQQLRFSEEKYEFKQIKFDRLSEEKKSFNFERMIEVLQLQTLQFLSDKNLLQLMRVNKKWNGLVREVLRLRLTPLNQPNQLWSRLSQLPHFFNIWSFAKTFKNHFEKNDKRIKNALKREVLLNSRARYLCITDVQHEVINIITTGDVNSLSNFITNHPDFNFDYLYDGLSPLWISKLFAYQEIETLLSSHHAKLIPKWCIGPDKNALIVSSIELLHQTAYFAHILAQDQLFWSEFTGRPLRIKLVKAVEHDLPLASTIDVLLRNGRPITDFIDSNMPTSSLILELLDRTRVWGSNAEKILEVLIQHGIDEKFFLDNEHDVFGRALLNKIAHHSYSLLKLIFTRYPAFCKANSENLLHNACNSINRIVDNIIFLLGSGADITRYDDAGNTPLHYLLGTNFQSISAHSFSSYQNFLGLVRDLYQKNPQAFHLESNLSWTPFLSAASVWRYDVLQLLAETKEAPSFIKATDKDGNTALHLAVDIITHKREESYCLPTLQVLLAMGVDVNAKNNQERTALHTVFARLIYNARNYVDREWKLHLVESIKLLLSHPGVDLMLRNEKDPSVVDLMASIKTYAEDLLFTAVKSGALRYDSEVEKKPLLHHAIDERMYSLVSYFFNDANVNVNLFYESNTPISKIVCEMIGNADSKMQAALLSLVKGFLRRNDLNVNLGSLNPLMAAYSSGDLTLFGMILRHPSFKFSEHLELFSTLVNELDSGTQHRSTIYREMLMCLCRRSDFILALEYARIDTCFSQATCPEDQLLYRAMLIHPNYSVFSLRIFQDADSRIIYARKCLLAAEAALLKNDIRQFQAHLNQARKFDAAMLDIFVQQVINYFATCYPFTQTQREQLLQASAVKLTQSASQMLFIAQYYEVGYGELADRLFAEGLYRKAKTRHCSLEESAFITNSLARLESSATEQKEEFQETAFCLKVKEYQSGFWKKANHDDAEKILQHVQSASVEKNVLRIALLEVYTDLICCGQEKDPLVLLLKQAISQLPFRPGLSLTSAVAVTKNGKMLQT